MNKKKLTLNELKYYDNPALTSVIYYWKDYDKDSVILAYILLKRNGYKTFDKSDLKKLNEFVENEKKSIEELVSEYNIKNEINNLEYKAEETFKINEKEENIIIEKNNNKNYLFISSLIIIFSIIVIFIIVNIDNNNSTPSCDKTEVIQELSEMNKIKTRIVNNDIINEIVAKVIKADEDEMNILSNLNRPKKTDREWLYFETFNSYKYYIELYFENENRNDLSKEIIDSIKEVIQENNYTVNDFIKYEDIYPSISNIRLDYIDKEINKCGCNADVIFEKSNHLNKSIYYYLQNNTDGETYIELYKN